MENFSVVKGRVNVLKFCIHAENCANGFLGHSLPK